MEKYLKFNSEEAKDCIDLKGFDELSYYDPIHDVWFVPMSLFKNE